ncbi:MAG: RES family NAD+ phosphorylase [Steroidobacteraceae bacterium]|nr:RES family NAD+ phosphorylase [Steroidobacteraceae bacterium]
MPSAADIATRQVRLTPSHRIVASRLPTIHLFERIADPADWDALYQLESLTNPRLRQETGELSLVPQADRVAGPNASVVMAPFTHVSPPGSRFADGTFGAYYAAESQSTAIAETRYHRERFMRATHEPAMELEMRSYLADIDSELHDLRGRRAAFAREYDPQDYGASQALGRQLRAAGANGIAFDSVRRVTGQCVAIFRPRLVRKVRQGVHLRYVWNGERITDIYELRVVDL